MKGRYEAAAKGASSVGHTPAAKLTACDISRIMIPMNDWEKADPTIEKWLSANIRKGDKVARTLPSLTAITLMIEREKDVELPVEFMQAWRRLIVQQRRTVDQAEENFISQSRRQGASWEGIARDLGLNHGKAAEEYYASLVDRLEGLHPGNSTKLWKS
jgi:hypothetical protein